MSSRSSIFSFSTYRAGLRPSARWIVAVAVLLAVNVAFVVAGVNRVLFSSIPRQIIHGYLKQCRRGSDILLVGNSTLEAGVDVEELQSQLGVTASALVIGSGSFRAATELARRCQRENPHPARTVVFVTTKDDFNANGYRAHVSQAYFTAMYGLDLKDRLLSYIPVYSYRISARQKTYKWIKTLLGMDSSRPAVSKGPKRFTDLSRNVNNASLIKTGQDFSFDDRGFHTVGRISEQQNAPERILLVLPPVSRSVAAWQDLHYSKLPWRKVRALVHENARRQNMGVLDLTDLFPSTTEFFTNNYHVNKRGKEGVTRRLVRRLRRRAQ